MITKALASNGAKKVYITGRCTEVLDKAAKESTRDNIIPLPGDVSSKERLLPLAEHVRKEDGYLNLLNANAGASGPSTAMKPYPIKEDKKPTGKELQEQALSIPMKAWDDCLQINMTSVFYNIMAFVDLLEEGNKRATYYAGDVRSQVIITSSVEVYIRARGTGLA